jgi:AraC-like DNA-binding protein
MSRVKFPLPAELSVNGIFTFYYREFPKRFFSKSEAHDYWEMVCADKGEVEIVTDSGQYTLHQGDVIFYRPNEYHKAIDMRGTSPNLIILTFECLSPCMDYFAGQCFRLCDDERSILSRLIREGLRAFDPPIDSPLAKNPLNKREGAPFGIVQTIRNYLEIFLITLIRRGESEESCHDRTRLALFPAEGERANDMLHSITGYMEDNLADVHSNDQLCKRFAISQTAIKTLFKERTGVGPIEYLNQLRIKRAKQFIREQSNNFTEIAERLGYSSVHYFSRHFKKETGMTPTEYARLVNARTERGVPS